MKKFTQNIILFISMFLLAGLSGITTVSLAQVNPWTFKNTIPTGRGFTGGAVVDGKIYVIGGFLSHSSVTAANEMYDPATDQWTVMEPMPQARCAHATCTFNGKIYVFGGLHPNPYAFAKNDVHEYDPQTDTWTQKANMPYEIAAPGIAVLNDTIYLIGGTTNAYTPPISTVMAYDPVTETWTEKAPLSSPRAFVSACVVDGKIYIFGGGDENLHDYAFDYVEVYDPATNTWTAKTNMPTSRVALETCLMDGKIYAVGGWLIRTAVASNEMYDPATDTWTIKSPIQQRRLMFFFGSVGNKIYAIGGSYPDSQGNPIIPTSIEEYDPAADTTSATSVESNIDMDPMPFVLHHNYPNPFHTSTSIWYNLNEYTFVKLSVYDLLGHEMQVLVNKKQSPGEHTVTFNADKLARGIYYYKIEAKSESGHNYVGAKKLILSK
jgi:N-acetylneuraminic acid mutarotase